MTAIARILAMTLVVGASEIALGDTAAPACERGPAQWLEPASGRIVAARDWFERVAGARIVLLGEEHTNAEHHRWQSYVLAALHSRNTNLAIGFEMLPRRAQPALDAWSAGALDADAFLRRVEWDRVWGYDAALYLPLLHFARLNRLPAVALNVDRELVSLVGDTGWQQVPAARREGVSDPAPPSDAYRDSLARLYAFKQAMGDGAGHGAMTEPDSEALARVKASEAFHFFVEAQLTWDRAMAEALATAARRDPRALVVGIVGRGHLEHGHGIPHQLADLGVDDVMVLLPVSTAEACEGIAKDLASGVFLLPADAEAPAAARPRLGVVIEAADGGVAVIRVVDHSVAAESGVRAGDVIESAAGFPTTTPAALIEIVTRQAPGTWLPLRIRRDEDTHELVARFPQRFDATP